MFIATFQNIYVSVTIAAEDFTGIMSTGGPDGTWKMLRPNWSFGWNLKMCTIEWTNWKINMLPISNFSLVLKDLCFFWKIKIAWNLFKNRFKNYEIYVSLFFDFIVSYLC